MNNENVIIDEYMDNEDVIYRCNPILLHLPRMNGKQMLELKNHERLTSIYDAYKEYVKNDTKVIYDIHEEQFRTLKREERENMKTTELTDREMMALIHKDLNYKIYGHDYSKPNDLKLNVTNSINRYSYANQYYPDIYAYYKFLVKHIDTELTCRFNAIVVDCPKHIWDSEYDWLNKIEQLDMLLMDYEHYLDKFGKTIIPVFNFSQLTDFSSTSHARQIMDIWVEHMKLINVGGMELDTAKKIVTKLATDETLFNTPSTLKEEYDL